MTFSDVIVLDSDNEIEDLQYSRRADRTHVTNNVILDVNDSDSEISNLTIHNKKDSVISHIIENHGFADDEGDDDDDDDFVKIFGPPSHGVRRVENIDQNIFSSNNNSFLNKEVSNGIQIIDDFPQSLNNNKTTNTLLPDSSIHIISSDDEQEEQDNVQKNTNLYPSSSPNFSRIVNHINLDIEEIENDQSSSYLNMSSPPNDSMLITRSGSKHHIQHSNGYQTTRVDTTSKVTKINSMNNKHSSDKIKRSAIQLNIQNETQKKNLENQKRTTGRRNLTGSSNIFNTYTGGNQTISSEISDFSSSLHDIVYKNTLIPNDEMKKHMQTMKSLKEKESNRVKNIITDLADIRSKRVETSSKYDKAVTQVLNSIRKATDVGSNNQSDITNSSNIIESPKNFMNTVTDDINLYTDDRLELLLERSKQLEPQKLKKVNQVKYSKEEITEKITCCFSSTLDTKLKELNEEYSKHITPAKFEILEDTLPIIRFKRFVDSIFFAKKNTNVPIPGRQNFEDLIILVYDAKELISLFREGKMKRNINTIKAKYTDVKIAVWVLGYDQYLQSLKTKVNRLYKLKVQARLDPDSVENQKKNKKKDKVDSESVVKPSDIKQKLLKYEVEYDFTFQSFKGLKDFIEWLISICYTLSSKYIDYLQRNYEISNIGKVKSGDASDECVIQMLSQFKGMTETRAKKFVDEKSYKSAAEIYRDVLMGVSFTTDKILRTDHEKLIRKVFLSTNENELL